jgi:hypothetical protein
MLDNILTKTCAVLLFCSLGTAQTAPSKTKKTILKRSPPIFAIKLSEESDLGSMPWAKNWPDPPQGDCNGDGNLYVWRWPPGQGLAGFTANGIATFLSGQMTDIPTPFAHGSFISQSAVYVGVDGTENAQQETKTIEDNNGQKTTVHNTTGERHRYIARFDKDGTYRGAIKLDLPFYVSTFAAFDSGAFVAQGLDDNKVPRVALLDSSGQLIRYLELPKDVSAKSDIPTQPLEFGGGSADIGSVVMFSDFTAAQGKILFLRGLASTSVYEIQESGEVRVVTIKSPAGYDVEGLVSTDRNWLVRFRKPHPNGAWSDARHSLFEVDPQNGNLLTEYRLEPPDTGVSCFADGEFWAVHYKDGKLSAARGSAEPYRGQ